MSDKKTMLRLFTVSDFEKEEAFLREQHKNGWRFVKFTFPCFFKFEACEPEDVVYQLDFSPASGADKESYLQMFRDYGWEYLQDCNNFSYFRKPAKEQTEGDEGIFSDVQSKIDMIDRIIKTRMLPLLIIFMCIIIPNLAKSISGDLPGTFFYIYLFLFALYVVLFLHCGRGLKKLRDKYTR